MKQPSFEEISAALTAAFPRLTATEQRVALAAYRLLAEGRPVKAEGIAAKNGADVAAVRQMLDKWHGVERNADNAVTGFWGLTLSETKHRFRVGGRELYTWCAWDTLFLPSLLGVPAAVASACPASGERIALSIAPSGVRSVDPETAAVSFLLPSESEIEQSVTETFCCYVHFFATRQAAHEWVSTRPRTFVLAVGEAWHVGMRRNATQFAAVAGELALL